MAGDCADGLADGGSGGGGTAGESAAGAGGAGEAGKDDAQSGAPAGKDDAQSGAPAAAPDIDAELELLMDEEPLEPAARAEQQPESSQPEAGCGVSLHLRSNFSGLERGPRGPMGGRWGRFWAGAVKARTGARFSE